MYPFEHSARLNRSHAILVLPEFWFYPFSHDILVLILYFREFFLTESVSWYFRSDFTHSRILLGGIDLMIFSFWFYPFENSAWRNRSHSSLDFAVDLSTLMFHLNRFHSVPVLPVKFTSKTGTETPPVLKCFRHRVWYISRCRDISVTKIELLVCFQRNQQTMTSILLMDLSCVLFVVKWPCQVDRTFKSNYKLTTLCPAQTPSTGLRHPTLEEQSLCTHRNNKFNKQQV